MQDVDGSAATTQDEGPKPGAPYRRRGVRIAILVAAIAVLASVVCWRWWTERSERIALGDRGEVTAVVTADCASLTISIDDEVYRSAGSIPLAWRGRSVSGRLHLDERDDAKGDAAASGRFEGAGATVSVSGGRGVFFKPACGIWPE